MGQNGGYNNGVYVLDELCGQMYSNVKLGATAKSVKIEDIQNVTDKSKFNYNNYSKSVAADDWKFGDEISLSSGSTVPYILYNFEAINIENHIARQSVQPRLVNDEYISLTEVKKVSFSAYEHEYSSTDWLNSKYHNLVYDSKGYVLSSRFVDRYEYSGVKTGFDFRTVMGYKVNGISKAYGLMTNGCLRPMVSIPLSSCVFDSQGLFESFVN